MCVCVCVCVCSGVVFHSHFPPLRKKRQYISSYSRHGQVVDIPSHVVGVRPNQGTLSTEREEEEEMNNVNNEWDICPYADFDIY